MDYGNGVAVTPTQSATIASGVLTVTDLTPVIEVIGEGAANDQLDTFTVTNKKVGDTVMLVSDGSDTITVDDANIDLGAAVRAVGPGGNIILRWDGTSWAEVSFLAGADNVT